MDKLDLLMDLIEGIDRKTDKIENKVDKLDTRLDRVDITLAKQEEQLAEHIRRTNLLEEQMKPVEDHVKHMSGALKLFGVISIVSGGILAVLKLLGALKGL